MIGAGKGGRQGTHSWRLPLGPLARTLRRRSRGKAVAAHALTATAQPSSAAFRTLEQVEVALRAAGIGLWEWHPESDRLVWSEEHERLAGVDPGAFGGSTDEFLALMHTDDRRQMESVMQELDGSGSFGGSYRVVLPGGGIRWLQGKGTLSRSPNGELMAVGMTHDVTAQREAEARRQAADQKAAEIVEAISAAFFAVERDWTLSYVNRAGEELDGRRREELIGTSLWDVPGLIDSEFEPHYRRAMAERVPVAFEAYWEPNERWVDVRAYPTATGISLYLDDVTERHRLEDDLHQAQKMQAVGQLAGGVAHDFNNLLTAISGYAGLLANRSDVAPEAQEQIREIARAAARAADLTRQLLAFSRRQTLVPTVVEPNTLLQKTVPMLRRLVGEHIRVTVTAAPDLRSVFADPTQIEQVLMNLVVNAAQAMPLGGTVTIETNNVDIADSDARFELEPGSYIALAVADTGCGMDEATARRAFDPFFTTKEQDEGTGLGLATVHGIATQSGGTARIHTRLNKGTCVTVYLPATNATPTPQRSHPHTTTETTGSEKILLVDDNASVRQVIARMLSSHGYDVTVAASASEAIELVEAGMRPHVLLTDVVMPQTGGPELAVRLTKLAPQLRTVLASGYSEHGLLHDGAGSLEAVFLQKPFTSDEAAAAIRSALASH